MQLENWNAYRIHAILGLLEEETSEFIPPQLWPLYLQDLKPLAYSMWVVLQEKVYWERSGPSWIVSLLWQPFVSGVVDSSRAVMRVLYTFSCNISHMLLSTGFNSGEVGGYSWGGINSGVSFCNNSTVARAQWAFQVSQGSVATLFRWGGKCLIILQQTYLGNGVLDFIRITGVL